MSTKKTKQISTKNSDNIKNKIMDKTFVKELEEENYTEKSSNFEESSVGGLSDTCDSCYSSKSVIKGLKHRLKELELKLKINDLTLENNNLKLQKEQENEIKNLNQNFQKLVEENNKLKAENDEKINSLELEIKMKNQKIDLDNKKEIEEIKQSLKQKDEKINSLEKEITKKKIEMGEKVTEQENKIKILKQDIKQLKNENAQKDCKISSLEKEIAKANNLLDKKRDASIKISCNEYLDFIKNKNKWSEIDFGNGTITNSNGNTGEFIGKCIIGNGFIYLIDDENVKYINLKGKAEKLLNFNLL